MFELFDKYHEKRKIQKLTRLYSKDKYSFMRKALYYYDMEEENSEERKTTQHFLDASTASFIICFTLRVIAGIISTNPVIASFIFGGGYLLSLISMGVSAYDLGAQNYKLLKNVDIKIRKKGVTPTEVENIAEKMAIKFERDYNVNIRSNIKENEVKKEVDNYTKENAINVLNYVAASKQNMPSKYDIPLGEGIDEKLEPISVKYHETKTDSPRQMVSEDIANEIYKLEDQIKRIGYPSFEIDVESLETILGNYNNLKRLAEQTGSPIYPPVLETFSKQIGDVKKHLWSYSKYLDNEGLYYLPSETEMMESKQNMKR